MLSKLALRFIIGIATLCLTACSTTELKKIKDSSSDHNITKKINVPRPQKLPKTILPIKTALDSNKERKAEKLHSDLLLSLLTPEERIYYEILGAEIAWRKGDLSLMDDHLALLRGEIPLKPGEKIYENDFVLSFYDINPKKKVHALIIPKGEYINLDDFNKKASDKEITEFHRAVSHVSSLLGATDKGYRVLSNIGSDGGQEVPHLHFHIFAGEKIGKMVA